MYIGYDIKNGIKYAKLCKSTRVNGKVKTEQKSLGRVLDESKGSIKAVNVVFSPMISKRTRMVYQILHRFLLSEGVGVKN